MVINSNINNNTMCASDTVTVSEQSRLRIKTLLGFFQREPHILGGGTNSYLSVWTAKPHLYPRCIKWTTRTAIFTSRDDEKNTVLANLNQCKIRHLCARLPLCVVRSADRITARANFQTWRKFSDNLLWDKKVPSRRRTAIRTRRQKFKCTR